MADTRLTWDKWGLELAKTVALRADCTRRQVGAVLLSDDHRVLGVGYNGAPPGAPGCLTDGACPRGQSDVAPGSSYDTGAGSCIALHAEQNLLLQVARIDTVGTTLYCTDYPCDGCMRMILGTYVQKIVTPEWNWDRSRTIFRKRSR